MTRCPSELKLELHLLDPASSPVAGHVAGCAACGARLAEMERLGDEFRAQVFPATADRVVAAARPRFSLSRLLTWAPIPALAAAAALLFLVPHPQPPDDYVGVKGADIALAVFAQAQGTVLAVTDGGKVPAGAALRFQVKSSVPCQLWLVSVDGAGQVSRLYPASGDASMRP